MGKTVVLSNGHGGVINGVYQTAGKRSPNRHLGVLYEGMFNRWVVNGIIQELDRLSIPYYHVSPELTDVTLETRVERVRRIWKKDRNIYFLDIHANAGGGEGIEGFTTDGETASDAIAEIFLCNVEEDLKNQKMRFDFSDGDRDKESNYYVLRNTPCPAFLFESGFMDGKKDYQNLWDKEYLNSIICSLVRSIVQIYNA